MYPLLSAKWNEFVTNFDMKSYKELRLGDIVHLWHFDHEFMLVINVDMLDEPGASNGFYTVNCLRNGVLNKFSINRYDRIRVLKC